ncbi:ISAs1 family transposase [Chlorogloea sp. CCALA 695]|uniref:ISAs1 family transposase n=1 Tax=Chlorogloea sp. CCALA 695 TaxID=2107693 RepID=UPI000D061C23|nr:ISAs1 family transposase [Chlorogloea sp. CCALA 695]PSB28216.1 hypothetical protein C7B70_21380 [Chlorogloea sp. CCALA 695]
MRAATITSSASKVINARLLAQLKTIAEAHWPCERFVDIEKNRDRTTCRLVSVFADLHGIDKGWLGAKSCIQVERIGIRSGKQYLQTSYYISSLISKAMTFAEGIRQHWGIENRLHWVKNVIFGEDAAPFSNSNAATTEVYYPQYRAQYRADVWL